MAEAAMFSLASHLLSTVASPAFKIAYEKGRSIWEASDELDKLSTSIQTIQAVLVDAEKKQESSAAVRDWIKRVRDVLYDADDLFDEIATDDMLKQRLIKEDKLLKKVRASCSKLNPIVSRDSIAKKVKAIRKSLLEISTNMEGFKFVESVYEQQPIRSVRKGQESGSFVDSKDVIGREVDKKAILEMLLDEKSNNAERDVPVIAIVGIGGMGKTALAQLVYNDEEVLMNFDKRWFACISDISDDKEILGKIFQSLCEKNYVDFTMSQLETKIRESVEGEKFLLVLDDVWDDDHDRWIKRMRLLSGCAKGSKIIVTTRSLSVARVVSTTKAHMLGGLSEDESWNLFKRVAFGQTDEQDSRWINLGKEIVKKCANVPLAIRSVGSLLYTKTTIQEWESFKNEELSVLEQSGESVMHTLKLSYDHLPPNLKHCFAYCSLFPKDFTFEKDKLINLWIAQGYIKPNSGMQTVEEGGHSYFMDLFRRSFFQEAKENEHGEIFSCKMHDLIHDLAQQVAGEGIILLTRTSDQINKSARHVGVGHEMDSSWKIVERVPNTNRLRSLMFFGHSCFRISLLDHQFANFKCLRALSLKKMEIKKVSSSVGELKHLRHLDLSGNLFKSLPDSMTNLLNLLSLDIGGCSNLTALPDSFKRLINMRHLNIERCHELKSMPPGMGELTCLRFLSDFKVGKTTEGAKRSRPDVLAVLDLRGVLRIKFDTGIHDWGEDECWQLPVSPQQLWICDYPGIRIPERSNERTNNLTHLYLRYCSKVKHLPSLRCLPNLNYLSLVGLYELEYIEEEDSRCTAVQGPIFFPVLETLQLKYLPILRGWRRKKLVLGESQLPFPLLSQLTIEECLELKSIPLCPRVEKLVLGDLDVGVLQQLLSAGSSSLQEVSISRCNALVSFPDEQLTFLRSFSISDCGSLKSFQLMATPHLYKISINNCDGLISIQVQALASLGSLHITFCRRLKSMCIARLSVLRELIIWGCPQELELWGLQQQKRCVDWDSLPNLRQLDTDRLPSPEELPNCLGHRQALGQFQINSLNRSRL